MSYATWHWRVFNVVARLFGVLACLVALVFLLTALVEVWTHRLAVSPLWFGIGAICLFPMGVAFLRVRPYRPDVKSDDRAGWWTGEPKRPATMASNNRWRGP
jgi:hypothetical protein